MNPAPDDPVVAEVRAARKHISERCGHDPERLVAYYLALQQQYRDRLLEAPKPPDRADPSAA